ncbi:MAG TPA: hypothetical protein VLZ74_09575 [Methylocella sp.]|nr:hypothetical protein [Methylocella sp.]
MNCTYILILGVLWFSTMNVYAGQTLIGPLERTCQNFSTDNTNLTITAMWIAGYTSGINNLTPSDFLKGHDISDVLDSILEACKDHPEKTARIVARDVVAKFRMEAAKRILDSH